MPIAAVRILVFTAAFILFVPVRWHIWGGKLRDYKWNFLDTTFGQMVDKERANKPVSVTVWVVVIALLTVLSTA
ncbi:MAG: hypothetical protein Q8K89_07170 [Actinomycetota bacterium]|nr:hypothetical protein [Actinomycetota bacterium]